MVDYDNTLHDSDSKFTAKLDGIMGLEGRVLWDVYLKKAHRDIVHKRFPEKHDDGVFHCKLVFEYLHKPYDRSVANDLMRRYKEAEEECWKNPKLYPETIPFLNHLKVRKCTVCLITGGHAVEKARGIEKSGSRKYFNYV